MLHIKSIRLLSKVVGLFDQITTPDFILKVCIDDNFFFPQVSGSTEQNQTIWQDDTFPLLQLTNTQKPYKITFIIYRDGILLGTATTTVSFSQHLREQNDVLNSSHVMVGKILYQCQWYHSVPPGLSHITNEQYLELKYHNAQTGGDQPAIPTTVESKNRKKYVRKEGDENCGGFCGCFGVRKKKQATMTRPPQLKQQSMSVKTQSQDDRANGNNAKVKQVNGENSIHRKPLIYKQTQLGPSNSFPHLDPPKKLTYYSKTYQMSR